MAEISLQFKKERDTKNAVKFEEVVADGRQRGVVGSLYVLKSDLSELGNPDTLTVRITASK